ncbi:Calmodulin like 42 [Theobroma cacao]|uniref:Calmodulin like 42 n=1 Tax=Theobroma cacao TaxID=3641 RepID=A0A061EPX4_THECC|nr:Calmodulin like 42 [Theobroma cacao]
MEMEAAAAASADTGTDPQCKRSLSRKVSSTSSFRLRCPSLNSLRLRRIFDIFDKNGDGMITVQEINLALSLLGLEADLSELHSTIKSFIEPGNIGLKFEDFVALHQSLDQTFFGLEEDDQEEGVEDTVCDGSEAKMSQEDSDLTEAFKVFDEDGDGFISAQELQVVLGKLGLPEGREIDRVQQMICSVDQNHDGRVDFFEFKHMMQSVIVRSS